MNEYDAIRRGFKTFPHNEAFGLKLKDYDRKVIVLFYDKSNVVYLVSLISFCSFKKRFVLEPLNR